MSFAGTSRTDVEAQLEALQTEYGEFPVRDHTVEVTRELLSDAANIEGRRALGGTRALIAHDDERLLVREDENAAWDAPGGDRDAGEPYAAAARRHVHETTGLECSIDEIALAHRYEFTLVEGTTGVTGLWILFQGETADPSLEITDDVEEADWFLTPPRGIAEDVAKCFDCQDLDQS